MINSPIIQEVTSFADSMVAITESCNRYFNNQIPQKYEHVIQNVKEVTEQFAISSEEHIKEVLGELRTALAKDRSNDANGEMSLIEEVRKITDIVESQNLVLTFKAKV